MFIIGVVIVISDNVIIGGNIIWDVMKWFPSFGNVLVGNVMLRGVPSHKGCPCHLYSPPQECYCGPPPSRV